MNQETTTEYQEHGNHTLLALECAKLDPEFESALAEEGLTVDLADGPEY